MDKTFYDLLYLCRCAVNQRTPDREKIDSLDLTGLYDISSFHSLQAITAYALESVGIKEERFKQAKEKAIRKNILFDSERRKLFDYFEQEGIWYMPLKGSILKEFYPALGMRQMSDNDILFDVSFRAEVRNYFEARGYETVEYGTGYHDVYKKPPVLNFEMHMALFEYPSDEKWQIYYSNVRQRLKKDADKEYGLHFSDEDFYIYLMMHEYKHYSCSGTGLRSLLDRYVFLCAKKDMLDIKYIESECKKLTIAEFEKQGRELAYKVFGEASDEKLSDSDRKMLERYLFSGTYGTLENYISAKIEKLGGSRLQYYKDRLFPEMEYYKVYYPFFYRWRIFIPIFLIYRFFRAMIMRGKQIACEIRIARKYFKDSSKSG